MIRTTAVFFCVCIAISQGFKIPSGGASSGGDGDGTGVTQRPYTTRIIPTKPNLPCHDHMDSVVESECLNKPEGYMTIHPDNDEWYINCNGIASVCQPCPGDLVFNNDCKMCLNRGDDCPAPTTAPANNPSCPDDGCPFCSTLYATEAHADVLNYCQCNNDVAVCMPCGCGTKFDAKMGCCMTDLVNGRKC